MSLELKREAKPSYLNKRVIKHIKVLKTQLDEIPCQFLLESPSDTSLPLISAAINLCFPEDLMQYFCTQCVVVLLGNLSYT